MAPRFNKSQFNSVVRKAESAAKDLERHGRRLQSAARDLDRENHRFQAQLRRLPSNPPRVPPGERAFLADVARRVEEDDQPREHDAFVCHAGPDLPYASELAQALTDLGADVWIDDLSIKLGQNITRAIDRGILSTKIGVVLVTPAVLAGRQWVERELAALLNSKETVIPVLHGVDWGQLQAYSPTLHVNRGITTEDKSVDEVATLIASTFMMPTA